MDEPKPPEATEKGEPFPSPAASLRVFSGDRAVYTSSGRWLYPLFDLEAFLDSSPLSPSRLSIEDKIMGKAAACLIVRMGFRRVYGQTMSRLAERVFRERCTSFGFGLLVDRIDCRTEALLEGVDDVEEAYRLVRERAGR